MTRGKGRRKVQETLPDEVRLRFDDDSVGSIRPWGEYVDSATSVVVEYPLDLSLPDALRQLEGARWHLVQAELLLGGQVGAARAAGASWATIALTFGLTGEAVRKRFGPRLGE